MNNICGAIDSNIDIRDYKAISSLAENELPKELELKMVRVKNQKQVNSCVAHAISSVIEYYNSIQNNQTTEMSVGYIYGNRRKTNHKGKGMIMRDAIATACEYGDIPNDLFPYNEEIDTIIDKYEAIASTYETQAKENKFTAYYKLTSEKDIKTALYNNCPVLISIKWYSDIKVKNGIITTNCIDTKAGNHCIVIYGWNEKGWKILNSWGKNWGNKGTAILPYNIPIREAWSVLDTYMNESPYGFNIKKPYNSNLGNVIAKVINIILNLIKNFTEKG